MSKDKTEEFLIAMGFVFSAILGMIVFACALRGFVAFSAEGF